MEEVKITTRKSLPEPVEVVPDNVKIPICCIEGHDDCPHVINKEPVKSKKNIGL